jgi:Carboxypeptidase regulatory-like domain/TonB dependent receptor
MKRICLWIVPLLLLVPLSGAAQTVTGAIRGIITDPSGAIVPNATVTAINAATSVPTIAKTNQAGEYAIRFLQIGQYKLTVEAPGFTTARYGPFSLEIDQTAQINIPLAVGSATTTVDVNEQLQPILNTENATLGETFTENTINNIPLNGRDFSQLTVFTPGAVSTGYGMYGSQNSVERSTNADNESNVNGSRQQSNNYLLDGQEINENLNNTIGYNPSPDSLEQIRVISSNANAEFGNVNGGDVVMVTKSGSNNFHGSAFGFLENENLNANSWSNDAAGIPKGSYTQTIFGATFGGPIIKDKLFFFVDYEGLREHSSGLQLASVAPLAFRTGDLSSLLSPNFPGGPRQLYDSQNIGPDGQPVAYQNNQISITNPVAQYLFANPAAYPLPNHATNDPAGIFNNFAGPGNSNEKNDQGDVKIDYHLRTSDIISGRYSQGIARDATVTDPIPVFFPSASNYPDHLATGTWTHTFSPAIVNSFRGSYARIRFNSGVTTDPSGIFGNNGNSLVGIPSPPQQTAGFSLQSFNGQESGPPAPGNPGSPGNGTLSSFGANPTPEIFIDNVFEYSENLTWQRGRHLMKFGAEFTRYQQNSFYPGNDGELGDFTYTGQYSANPLAPPVTPANPVNGNVGYEFADFLLDRVNNTQVGSVTGRTGQRQWRDAVFAQDDYKMMPNLTLNIGLRWSFDQPIYEVNNKMANLNLQTGAILYAGVDGNSRALYGAVYNQFQPRLGFAYSVTPKLVVRGGYGITSYLEGSGANLRLTQNPPFHVDFEEQGQNPTGSAATGNSPAVPYSPGVFFTTAAGFPTTVPPTTTFYAWKQHLQPAVTQEFSLTTEYELTPTTALSVGYVGILGQHLIDPQFGNQLTSPTATAPFANVVGQTGVVKITGSDSASNYNALQFTVRQHLRGGLEITANYTYSKSLTNDFGFYGVTNSNSGQYYQQNAYDFNSEWGPGAFDVRHALNVTGVYELPFGRGKRFAGNVNRVVDEAIGGWRLSGSNVTYSALPVTASSPANYSSLVYAFTGAARPNQNLPLHIVNRSLNAYFGTAVVGTTCPANQNDGACVFSQQPNNTFGNVRPFSLRGPGYEQIDMSLQKSFTIYHESALDFRVDGFNLFNIASYATPDSGVTDSNFGAITNTSSTERHLQLSLKYKF